MKLIRVILTILLALLPTSALAHDQLVDQSPGEGEIVEAGIVKVNLTFNNDLLVLVDSGAEILVTNQAGEPQNPGCALVELRDAKLELSLAEPGIYNVAWRVVSADGHPISGSYSFELVNTTGYAQDPNFTFIECADPILISEPDESEGNYWLLWVSLGLVAVGLFFYLRPRGNKTK